MEMVTRPRGGAEGGEEIIVHISRVQGAQTDSEATRESIHGPDQIGEGPGRIPFLPPKAEGHPGKNNLLESTIQKPSNLLHDVGQLPTAGSPPNQRDLTEGTGPIAPILNLEECLGMSIKGTGILDRSNP
jgi:hypothetical protein